jgi:phospholipase C
MRMGLRSTAIVVASILGAAGCSMNPSQGLPGFSNPMGSDQVRPRAASGSAAYIKHVVIMLEENRSFDDLFATFPGANGATRGKMKLPSGDVWVPLNKATFASEDLDHQHFSFLAEYDKGAMDGFNLVKRVIRKGVKVPAGKYPYRYADPKQLAPYWDIAKNYVLADDMFSTQSSSSFTAHQDWIAGGTPVDGDNVIDFPIPPTWGCNGAPGTVTDLITLQGKEMRGKGPFPCFKYATLRDLLDKAGLSWLYFTNQSNNSVWNGFDAIDAVRNGPEWTSNIVQPETQIFQTISDGQLPAVSWVIPDAITSDHPGNHAQLGPAWVASVVNAIGESQYWDNTLVVVAWDEWGGEFDHVPPPQLDGQGLGPRVAMLLVSAYDREASTSKPGYISHTQYEPGSVLKFIEKNWGLGSLGTSDVRANSIVDSFDFTLPPRPFIPIGSDHSKAFFEHMKPSGLPVDDN